MQKEVKAKHVAQAESLHQIEYKAILRQEAKRQAIRAFLITNKHAALNTKRPRVGDRRSTAASESKRLAEDHLGGRYRRPGSMMNRANRSVVPQKL